MPKYIVLGASSSIGRSFFNMYKKDILLATSNKLKDSKFKKFNLLKSKLNSLLKLKIKPTHLILFAAETMPDKCYLNPNQTNKLNYLIPKKIILFCLRNKITPVVFSSEFVSSGKIKNFTEEAKLKPTLIYGKQKKNLEKFVLKNKLNVLVLRLAKVYGDKKDDNTLLTSAIKQLRSKKEIKIAKDQFFSPVYVNDVVNVISLLCSKNITGLYNLSGPERLSRIQIIKTKYRIKYWRSKSFI